MAVAIIGLGSLSSCTKIDAANEGVRVDQYGDDKGNPTAVPVKGRVWYNPFNTDIFEYPAYFVQADYEAFTVNAAGGPVFTVDPMLNVRIAPGKAASVFLGYRKDMDALKETIILTKVKDAFKNVFNLYTTDSIINNRNKIDRQVEDSLRVYLERDNFMLKDLTFGIHYPKEITDAILAKTGAFQKTLQAETELKTTEINAKKRIIDAEANAKVNELNQRTLTPILIQKAFIDKWDGSTPLYGQSPVNFKQVQ